MLKKWDKQRVLEAIKYLGKTEEKIKKNSQINYIAYNSKKFNIKYLF